MTEILDELSHAALHTAEHTWYMLPLLFIVYLVIEIIEHKAMDRLRAALANKTLGIPAAAALGLFPQCGFSVAAANLYSERLITAGTVAAVFVATSDEAFPILISSPSNVKWFIPMLIIKFLYAIAVGFAVNGIFKLTRLDKIKTHEHHRHGSEHTHEGGEHHHCSHCDSNRGILSAAIRRTLAIFLFVFITSFVLHAFIGMVGEDKLSALLMTDSIFQPVLSALFGLIPNCAASVITTELFISGALGFGSLAAALCAGAGVGILVLLRVNRSMKQNFSLIGIIYAMSALLGVVIELIM